MDCLLVRSQQNRIGKNREWQCEEDNIELRPDGCSWNSEGKVYMGSIYGSLGRGVGTVSREEDGCGSDRWRKV